MSNTEIQIDREKKLAEKALTSETIFKYINLVIILVLIFCIKGFLSFREYCIAKGYYVFSIDSLIWCAVGFAGIFVTF
jgi:hypothetical protein